MGVDLAETSPKLNHSIFDLAVRNKEKIKILMGSFLKHLQSFQLMIYDRVDIGRSVCCCTVKKMYGDDNTSDGIIIARHITGRRN